jgi:type IV fimbrial biogenesis protein FimT
VNRSKALGLTLIEVLIALTILSILIATAAPNLRSAFINSRIRSAVEGTHGAIQAARFEALKRNATVNLSITGSGWATTLASDNSAIASGSLANGIAVTPATNTIVFDALGRAGGVAFSATTGTFNLQVSNPSQAACSTSIRCLQISLRPGGTSRVCDPNLTFVTDPRGC